MEPVKTFVSTKPYLDIPPFSLGKTEKRTLLTKQLAALTRHHYAFCPEYRKIVDALGFDVESDSRMEEMPFLPVRLFKMYALQSIQQQDIVKTMTSSGTTGQSVSKIMLDKATSLNQTKALAKIVATMIGGHRVPMLILDTEECIKNRNFFSARAAGIQGFSMFASKRLFALDENMQLRLSAVQAFLEENQGQTVLMYGFTSIIWQHVYRELKNAGQKLRCDRGVVIHGGGWKKLAAEAVTPEVYRLSLGEALGVSRVYDYYGMVEQTGSIFVECDSGRLHAPIYSDVLIRRPHDFSLAEFGEAGIIQLVSCLPASYPGHSILTEDVGVVLGEDDCPCGRCGKTLKVSGRLRNAEVRGCSDVYAARTS